MKENDTHPEAVINPLAVVLRQQGDAIRDFEGTFSVLPYLDDRLSDPKITILSPYL